MGADAANSRLQPCDAAPGCRQPHRAAGVGAHRPRRQARRHRHCRAAAGAAGCACAGLVPRVPRCSAPCVGTPAAHGELHGVRLAQHDHALRDQSLRQRRGALRLLSRPGLAAAGDHLAFEFDQVLERDRHAMERPHGVAGSDCHLRSSRCLARIVAVDLDEGVKHRIVPVDPRQECFQHLHRREAPRLELAREFAYAGRDGGQTGHGEAQHSRERRLSTAGRFDGSRGREKKLLAPARRSHEAHNGFDRQMQESP